MKRIALLVVLLALALLAFAPSSFGDAKYLEFLKTMPIQKEIGENLWRLMGIEEDLRSIAQTIKGEDQRLAYIRMQSSIHLGIVVGMYEGHAMILMNPISMSEEDICQKRKFFVQKLAIAETEKCLDDIKLVYGYIKTTSILHLLDQAKVILRQQIDLYNQELKIYTNM